jgi:hypothetical protein
MFNRLSPDERRRVLAMTTDGDHIEDAIELVLESRRKR